MSHRERVSAERYAAGLTSKQIAGELFIAPTTVRGHLSTIYRKLEIHNKTQLIRLFVHDGESSDGRVAISPAMGHEPLPAAPVSPPLTPRPRPSLRRSPAVSAIVLLAIVGVALAWLKPWESREGVVSNKTVGSPLPDKPSLAVRPFTNMSGDPKQDYFANGITDDLITDLSKVSGLFVIARNSTFVYKDVSVSVKQIAEDLGVRYVLEGSVRRSKNTVRVNAQLIDATTGGHVWAERYDGETVDSHDVVASVQHHRRKDSNSAARILLESITAIEADGKDVVVATLDQGNADFPYLVSDYHIPILPADAQGIDWRSGIGAGPYKLEEFESGVRGSFTRHPNYWKANRAHFDDVETLSILEDAARTNALIQGDIDVMSGCKRKTVHLLAKTPGIHVHETMGGSHITFPMRTDTAPFDNNDVRMALKYGLDREVLLDAILYGHGVIGNDYPISPANRYYASELPQRQYDPERARHHLRNAGYGALTVDLSTAETVFTGAEDAAVLYREHAAKAGITINVVHEPNDAYWQTAYMNKAWSTSVWSGRPTEDWMFSTAYVPGAQWNETFWDNSRFNALLIEARAEIDETKRRDMYVELQRIVRDEGGAVLPFFHNFLFASTDKLEHGPLLNFWDLDGLRLSERWWFA